MTSALGPVVQVTAGPGVARSSKVVEVPVSVVRTAALAEIRSEISLVPETAKCAPDVVALAGAVSLRLSRRNELN